MISLQRSMHSSQMYTPGPAISFLTCFWLFPQKEHLSRSPVSPTRATGVSLPSMSCRKPQPTTDRVRTLPANFVEVPCNEASRRGAPGRLGSVLLQLAGSDHVINNAV